jgi:hypothetical protein
MSEYQYYEFQTIDRPLTKAEQQEISFQTIDRPLTKAEQQEINLLSTRVQLIPLP